MRFSKLTTISLIAASCLLTAVQAWKYQGHILIARMAYDILVKEAPEALKKAEDLLAVMKGETITDSEKDHPFVEAAPFADMVKYKGGGWQSNWHFVDIPYLDQGGNINNYPDFKEDPKNISVAIPGIVDWLTGAPGYQNSFVYQTVMDYVKNNEQRGKSYSLRLLIHYLGDVHQPLHALSRINKEFPAGDRGGNDFPLPGHYSIKELHAAWDSVLYEFHVNDKLPYDEAGWNKLTESVNKLNSRFTISPNEYSTYEVNTWAHETFSQGSKNAYNGATMNQALPQDYVNKNNEIAARQLVLASHRLALVIKKIFGSKTTEEVASFLQ